MWISIGFFEKKIKPPATLDNSIALEIIHSGTKTRVKFHGGCLKQEKTTFSHKGVLNKLSTFLWNKLWSYDSGIDLVFKSSLFGPPKVTKNADPGKYFYSGYGIGFGFGSVFSFSNGEGFGKYQIVKHLITAILRMLLMKRKTF